MAPDRYNPDFAEPNETFRTARSEGTMAEYNGIGVEESEPNLSIHEPGDVDWFKVTLATFAAAGTFARSNFTHANGDLDLAPYALDGTRLREITSSNGQGRQETVRLHYLPPGT